MRLQLSRAQARELQREARRAAPLECCGVLLGLRGEVSEIRPLSNLAANPRQEFTAAPMELLQALMDAEARGLELLAVYHSHPEGPAIPSKQDIAAATYPGVAQLIIGRRRERMEMAAWRVEAGEVTRWPLRIGDDNRLGVEAIAGFDGFWLWVVGALITGVLTMGLALTALA